MASFLDLPDELVLEILEHAMIDFMPFTRNKARLLFGSNPANRLFPRHRFDKLLLSVLLRRIQFTYPSLLEDQLPPWFSLYHLPSDLVHHMDLVVRIDCNHPFPLFPGLRTLDLIFRLESDVLDIEASGESFDRFLAKLPPAVQIKSLRIFNNHVITLWHLATLYLNHLEPFGLEILILEESWVYPSSLFKSDTAHQTFPNIKRLVLLHTWMQPGDQAINPFFAMLPNCRQVIDIHRRTEISDWSDLRLMPSYMEDLHLQTAWLEGPNEESGFHEMLKVGHVGSLRRLVADAPFRGDWKELAQSLRGLPSGIQSLSLRRLSPYVDRETFGSLLDDATWLPALQRIELCLDVDKQGCEQIRVDLASRRPQLQVAVQRYVPSEYGS